VRQNDSLGFGGTAGRELNERHIVGRRGVQRFHEIAGSTVQIRIEQNDATGKSQSAGGS
jgi:hypothetical protein